VSFLVGYFTVVLWLAWAAAAAAVRERELGLFRFFDVSQSCATIPIALIIRKKGGKGGVGDALHAEVDFGYGS
jgi:hypothetical protein